MQKCIRYYIRFAKIHIFFYISIIITIQLLNILTNKNMIKRVCAHYQMITLSSTRPYHKSQTICLFSLYARLTLRFASSRILWYGYSMPPYGDFCRFESLLRRRLFVLSVLYYFCIHPTFRVITIYRSVLCICYLHCR